MFPIERIFADGGYAGQKMVLVVWRTEAWKLQIVKRSDAPGFEVLPKRRIVERTFAWISRNRRLARDFEHYATTVTAFVRIAMIRIMSNGSPQTSRHESKLLGWARRAALSPDALKRARHPGPPLPHLANRVKSPSDRVSARFWGRPTGEHRQSIKPRVRPLAPSPAGVLLLQHLRTSPIG